MNIISVKILLQLILVEGFSYHREKLYFNDISTIDKAETSGQKGAWVNDKKDSEGCGPTKTVFESLGSQGLDKARWAEKNDCILGSSSKIFSYLLYEGKRKYIVKCNFSDTWNSKINLLHSNIKYMYIFMVKEFH